MAKKRVPQPCSLDNCGKVDPRYGTMNMSMTMCQEHLRAIATGEKCLRVEIYDPAEVK